MRQKPSTRKPHPALLVCSATVLTILILTTCFDVRAVDGNSMSPTLPAGSKLIIFRLAYGFSLPVRDSSYLIRWKDVQLHDIIVFKHPETGNDVVKRCAGTPGDYVAPMGGGVTLIPDTSRANLPERAYPIPADHLYVRGDLPAASIDSRNYGLIKQDAVRGRVILTGVKRSPER